MNMESTQSDFETRLAEIRRRMASACQRAGRRADEVTLIAVTKNFGPEAVQEAWQAGIGIMGENRVQEAAAKIPASVAGPEWHLIGHLQRNKVRPALALFPVIHSVDSLKLAQQIDHVAAELGARPEILLEINAAGEASKFGLKPEEVPPLLEELLALRQITLGGLMTMAPIAPDPETVRPIFAAVRQHRDAWEREFGIALPQLSMGMSSDFEVAIEEGATLIRLGTALFGRRPKWRPAGGDDGESEQEWVIT